jgi:hypothetical protein
MSIRFVVLLCLAPAALAAQVDSSVLRAPAIKRLAPHVRREITRYAPAATDSVVSATARPARVLIERPMWVHDSLLVSRWADTGSRATTRATAISPATRLRYRPTADAAAVARPAQVDTTLKREASKDWRIRRAELDRLDTVKKRQVVHPAVTAALITQLDSVGVRRLNGDSLLPARANTTDREEYDEYVIALSRTVVRMKDVRAVRAITLSGLANSRAAQQFVADQGATSLPLLDSAFALDPEGSGAVVSTWARSLAGTPSRLTAAESVFVYGRILQARFAKPIAFLSAVRIAGLSELLPIVDSLAHDPSPAIAGAAKLATMDLARPPPARPPLDAGGWATRLRLYVGYLCAGTLDPTRQDCEELVAGTSGAVDAVARTAGRAPLEAALQRVTAAAGRMVAAQGATEQEKGIIENAARQLLAHTP